MSSFVSTHRFGDAEKGSYQGIALAMPKVL